MNRKTRTNTRRTVPAAQLLRALRFRDRKAPPAVICLPRVFFMPRVSA